MFSACADASASRPTEQSVAAAEAPALGTISLPLDSDVPLEPAQFVELGAGRFVAADPLGSDVWLFAADGPPPRRVARVDPAGRARVRGLALGRLGLGVLDDRGSLTVLHLEAFTPLRTFPAVAPAGAQLLGVAAQPDGSWMVLSQEMRKASAGDGGAAMLVLRRVREGPAVELRWETEKWNLATLGASVQDRSGLTGLGGTVTVSGSLPPRVVTFAADRAEGTLQSLVGGPVRPGSPDDLRAQANAFRQLPARLRERIPPLQHSPAVLRAWPVAGGHLVAAAGPDRSVALDAYCGGRFRRTLIAGPNVRDITVTPGAVIVLRRTAEGVHRLDFYAREQLSAGCT